MRDNNVQTITFAESHDLIHWRRPSELGPFFNGTYFDIDTAAGYTSPGRWDTIYSIPAPGATQENARDGYPRYGYWTASPTIGTFGFGVTEDGVSWTALESPRMEPPIGAELGAVEYIPFNNGSGGAYFALLGYGWPRTMLTYASPTPAGPFVRAIRNVNVINGSCYYARFFRGPQMEPLVTHQTWTNKGTHVSYISPFKLAALDDAGTLRLKWWAGNERLKDGGSIDTQRDAADPRFFAVRTNISAGEVLEATWTRPEGAAPPVAWPGFLVEVAPGRATVVALQPDGDVMVGDRRDEIGANYSSRPAPVPTHDALADWSFEGGAGSVGTRAADHNGSDIRSGGPGQTSRAQVAHPLDSQGHELDSVAFAFQYVAGYGCHPPDCAGASNLSLRLEDAFDGTLVRTLWRSGPLGNASYDAFTGFSPPVVGRADALAVGWRRQTRLVIEFSNNAKNVQVRVSTLNVTVGWGPKQQGPYAPEATTSVTVGERWTRDLPLGGAATGPPPHPRPVPTRRTGPRPRLAAVAARLLFRRDMLELYLDDILFPVYAMAPSTGRLGTTSDTAVAGVRRWAMDLPSGPFEQPAEEAEEAAAVAAYAGPVRINTTAAMVDATGAPIYDCLEPHIAHFDGAWWAYGFTARNASQQFATTIYSSPDLRAWTRRGFMPTNASLDGDNPQTAVALWYVVFNARAGQYVGYGAFYGKAINVYTSPHPAGPFTFRRRMSGVHGGGAGDMLVFQEGPSDGRAYLVYNAMHPDSGPPWTRFTYVYQVVDRQARLCYHPAFTSAAPAFAAE
jgi:hypothetical protein